MSLDIYQSPVSPELPDSLKSPDSPQSPVSQESTESHDLPDNRGDIISKNTFSFGHYPKRGPEIVGPFFCHVLIPKIGFYPQP